MVEHLVFNSYTYAHQSFLFTVPILILWLSAAPYALQSVVLVLITGYWIWAAIGFFRLRWWNGLLRGLAATVLATTVYMIFQIVAALLYVGFGETSG